jgi:hypothetical protein
MDHYSQLKSWPTNENNTYIYKIYQQQRAIVSVRFLVSRSLLIMKGQTLENFDQRINFKIMVQSTSPDKDMSDNVKTRF